MVRAPTRKQPPVSHQPRAAAKASAPARPDAPTDAVTAALGAEIRALRRAAGLTSSEAARRAGISPAMLSRIEAGGASPSLASIAALAQALGVPVARLFASHDTQRDCSLVPAGRGLRVERQASRAGHTYELLGHSLSCQVVFEPYLVTLGDDAQPHPSFQHPGTEMLYVLSGRMSYRYQGQVLSLNPGDTLVFDANAIHGPEELLERPIRYLSIVVNARS